jgi:act minimal PKS acyl carrier protein
MWETVEGLTGCRSFPRRFAVTALTLDALTRILEQDVAPPDVDLSPAILDVPFADLGYDSLAMLQVTSIIQQRCRVPLPDDVLFDRKTPRDLIEYVNGLMAPSGTDVVEQR